MVRLDKSEQELLSAAEQARQRAVVELDQGHDLVMLAAALGEASGAYGKAAAAMFERIKKEAER